MMKYTRFTEGRRIKTVGFDMISKTGKIGGDSDAKIKRGGAERYDKYDKASRKGKTDILQNELDYYMDARHTKKTWKQISTKDKDEIIDDIDDKFDYNTTTYKKNSFKVNIRGNVVN